MKSCFVAALVQVSLLLCAGCRADELEIVLIDDCSDGDDGDSFREAATYAQVLVFKNRCPPVEDLALGLLEGAVIDKVGAVDRPPRVGDLEPGKYGFAVVLRAEDCGVVGFGCTDQDGRGVDVQKIRKVNIRVGAWEDENTRSCTPLVATGCPGGQSCDRGRCYGTVGARTGCELDLVTWGVLPDSFSEAALPQGPVVTATPRGFAVGYREYASNETSSRITLLSISPSGELKNSESHTEEGCGANIPGGGVGIAFSGSQGILLASNADCSAIDDEGAGVTLAKLDLEGEATTMSSINKITTSTTEGQFFVEVGLADVHSIAEEPETEGTFLFTFRARLADDTTSIQLGRVDDGRFNEVISSDVFAGETVGFAQLAASDDVVAVLGQFPNGVTMLVGDRNDPLPPANEVELSGGIVSWAALDAWQNRVVGLTQASNGAAWSVVDHSGDVVSSAVLTGGPFSAGDAMVSGDHLIVVTGQRAEIAAYRIDGASGTLERSPRVTKALTSTSIGILEAFDGVRLSAAAGHDKVLAAWITQGVSEPGVPVGGWALLQCGAE